MKIKKLIVGELETNCYFVIAEKTKNCFVIDPGAEEKKIINELKQNVLNLNGIILTHAHPDHISAIPYLKKDLLNLVSNNFFSTTTLLLKKVSKREFRDLGIKIYIHSLDATLLKLISSQADVLLEDNDIISSLDESIKLKVIHTPGHTPGSICLIGDEFVFTGDTLFCSSVGRYDLPGGNYSKLMNSIKRLIELPKNYLIYPGHGPQCSISGEIEHNMFVREVML